eukprot:COSAG06_NODE_8800_length_2035_cov_5.980701_2_plen_211_part_00
MLPFVQCPRDDYCLRAETVSLLRGVGIEDELLTFGGNAYDDALCDNDLRRLHAEQRLKITLVDHNAMTPRQVRDSPLSLCLSPDKTIRFLLSPDKTIRCLLCLSPDKTIRFILCLSLPIQLSTHSPHISRGVSQATLGLPKAVVRIIDHHKDDGASPAVTGNMRRIGADTQVYVVVGVFAFYQDRLGTNIKYQTSVYQDRLGTSVRKTMY